MASHDSAKVELKQKRKDRKVAKTSKSASVRIGNGDGGLYRSVFIFNHFITMFKDFHELQKSGQYCDIMITCQEGHVKAHKLVLVVSSPEFQSLVNKSLEKGGVTNIDLSDIPLWMLEKIVEFLYTGKMQISDGDSLDLLGVCEKLGLLELVGKLKSSPAVEKADIQNSKTSGKNIKRGKRKYDQHRSSSRFNLDKDTDGVLVEDKVSAVDDQKIISVTEISNQNWYESDSTVLCEESQKFDSGDDSHLSSEAKTETMDLESGDKEHVNIKIEVAIENGSAEFDCITKCSRKRKAKHESLPTTDQEYDSENGCFEEHHENYCESCDQTFTTAQKLKSHKRKCKVNNSRKKCLLCNTSFESAEKYGVHRRTDQYCLALQKERRQQNKRDSRKKFSCRVCPRTFRRYIDQIEHEYLAHEMLYDKNKWPDRICTVCKL